MTDILLAQSLIGNNISDINLKYADFFVNEKLGVFIPNINSFDSFINSICNHPNSYMLIIEYTSSIINNQYSSILFCPNTPCTKAYTNNYYCILIEKEYFESQYSMYTDKKINYTNIHFTICPDTLRTINLFAFECSKKMPNYHITLNAQTSIITHWIIRSLLGTNSNLMAISTNPVIAHVEYYIEQHFSEKITINTLAKLVNISVSSFSRLFKKETTLTPSDYITKIRLEKSKNLLMKKNLPIIEIAIACGFSSSSHFSSTFYKSYAITPSEYRQSYF